MLFSCQGRAVMGVLFLLVLMVNVSFKAQKFQFNLVSFRYYTISVKCMFYETFLIL